MDLLSIAAIFVYLSASFFIFCYSIVQSHLLLLYAKNKKRKASEKKENPVSGYFPKITVQLPLYNELYVSERLVDAVAAFDYPKHLLQIQILDDSNDGTTALMACKTSELKALGFDIAHVRRDNRTGYKAGALDYGLKTATGELIAIFDADFVPKPDFLLQTVGVFQDPKAGVAQTRWGHINENYSLLTELQAFGLNAHFTVEQVGRSEGGHFINFNGTGGVWRKACIEDAGGWEADTLTEDLDLSYRAQLKGWRFFYLEDVVAPAELPAAMSALKSQQFRWTKGAAETMRKHLGKVLRSGLPLATKLHALFHLMNSAVFLCIILLSLLSVPMLRIKNAYPASAPLFYAGALFLLGFFSLGGFYYAAFRKTRSERGEGGFFIPKFLLFLSISMGLSLHNALAVIEGYIGKKTPFVRTPKFNINKAGDVWKNTLYASKKINPLAYAEMLMGFYSAFGLWEGWRLGDYGFYPMHLMLLFGYFTVAFLTVKQAFEK